MMDTLIQQWNNLPEETRNLALRVGLAVLALFLFWILRRLLAAIVVAPLRALAKRTDATWDELLLDAVTVPVRLLIIAFGLAFGAEILNADPTTRVFVQHLIRMCIIIALFMALYRAVNFLAPSSPRLFRATGLAVDERLLPFFRTAVKVVLLAVALVIIIQEWGYDVTGLVAGLGLGGLAFSLAAKDTVENLFGFTTVVGDQPFMVGDFIKTPDVEGTVERVGIRSTRVRQLDQAYVTVPNSKLAAAAVLNWSRLSKRWVNITLRIGYDSRANSIETLLERIRALLGEREKVEPDSIVVRLIDFGETGLEILVRCYVREADWGKFTEEKEIINLGILRIIEALGLRIALRSVLLENAAQMKIEIGDPQSSP
jgi:MscS family membrane protein